MSDPFASGTPWDDGDPIAGDFTAAPVRKVELGGPIFQSKGRRAVKMKLPKAPKQKRDPDDILGERTARVVWTMIRWQRTIAVILFLVGVALFTYSFAMGANGKAIEMTLPAGLLSFLAIPAGKHVLTPVVTSALAVIVSWMVSGIVGLIIVRPHGKFHRFTVQALVFAGAGAAADLLLGGILTHLISQYVHTSAAHDLPAKWAWLVDPTATPSIAPPSPITPTPTPTALKP